MDLIIIVQLLGFIFNITGGLLYFYFGILKKAPYPYKASVVIQYKDEMRKQKKYKRGLFYSKAGFIIFLTGFLFHLIALLFESEILKI